MLVAKLAVAAGAAPLNRHAGCWRYRLPMSPEWEIAVNPHRTPQPDPFGGDIPVEPFHCYVQYNGWPFALFSVYGGEMACGTMANEDTFRAAIDAELTTTKETDHEHRTSDSAG